MQRFGVLAIWAALILVSPIFPSLATGQAAPDTQAAKDAALLVGTWKLVSSVRVDDETKEEVTPFGDHPIGYLILLPSGRMMAIITAEGRKAAQTDSERANALDSMIAYTGKYQVEGNTFIVDAASYQPWVGSQQRRTFKLEGDRLLIVSMSQPSITNGKMGHGVLVWEREK